MQGKAILNFSYRVLLALCLLLQVAHAGIPLWRFEPLTATSIDVPENINELVEYLVVNQSNKEHILRMQDIPGITQLTTGTNACDNNFILGANSSCILYLQINGSQVSKPIVGGPVVCQQGSNDLCYQPNTDNILRITPIAAIFDTRVKITGSPLTLTVNGSAGQLTLTNASTQITATNITSDFTGTALDGNVTQTGNTCASLPPGGTCALTYTPGATAIAKTNFTIQGDNTNVLTAAITIASGSTLTSIQEPAGPSCGGTGFTLIGTGLTGATAVRFGGAAATNINVVNSTKVTGVTSAHAVGSVDIEIDTPAGGASLSNAYDYESTDVGKEAYGGIIACLNGGLNNLIAAKYDSFLPELFVVWGGDGSQSISGAQSATDGASNTQAIVTALGNNSGVPYAAQQCSGYEVDSQGHTPCQPGNACYDDWFLPAAIASPPAPSAPSSGQLGCLFANKDALNMQLQIYWSSTEFAAVPTQLAYAQDFTSGFQHEQLKSQAFVVRCVRAFTP